jgi:hypothetical protein
VWAKQVSRQILDIADIADVADVADVARIISGRSAAVGSSSLVSMNPAVESSPAFLLPRCLDFSFSASPVLVLVRRGTRAHNWTDLRGSGAGDCCCAGSDCVRDVLCIQLNSWWETQKL